MAKLKWLDFSNHNASTGDNIRAFSVNHPTAGRLVVLKGINLVLKPAMQGIGFTGTLDGSWVIKASSLNVGVLQNVVFPTLGLKEVELNEIDLTNQFVRSLETPANINSPINPYNRSTTTNAGLNWLFVSCKKRIEQFSSYEGILPAALSTTLWDSISSMATVTELANGQTVYEGTFNGEYFVLVRRPQLLSGPQRVMFYSAPSAELLPNVKAKKQKATVFQISDSLKEQLTEIGSFYTHKIGVEPSSEFSPSHNYVEATAQTEINLSDEFEGEIITVSLHSKNPFVLASSEFNDGISTQDLFEAFGKETTQEIIDQVLPYSWIIEPSQEYGSGIIKSSDLAKLPSVIRAVIDRKGDSIIFYKKAELSISGIDPFISSDKNVLVITPLLGSQVSTISTKHIVNQSKIPNGYTLIEGDDLRTGLMAIQHNDSGQLIRENDNAWFSSLTIAVKAIGLPENQYLVNPISIDIEATLDEVFEGEVEESIEANNSETTEIELYTDKQLNLEERYTNLIAQVNDCAVKILSTIDDTVDRVQALNDHKDLLIADLNAAVELISEISRDGHRVPELELIDLVDIGNPVICELYNRISESDVPLTYSSFANDFADSVEVIASKPVIEYPKSHVELRDVLFKVVESRSFDDANIEILVEQDTPIIFHQGNKLIKLSGETTREGVLLTLIKALGEEKFLTPELFNNLSVLNRSVLGDSIGEAYTTIFRNRHGKVVQDLIDQGFTRSGDDKLQSPSNDSILIINQERDEDAKYIYGVSYSVGILSISDDLTRNPKELAEALIELVNNYERQLTTLIKPVNATNDLFEDQSTSVSEEEHNPNSKVSADIIFSNASGRSHFLVSGNGLLLLTNKLKNMGGVYVRTHAAYKFKKTVEETVREALNREAQSLNLVIRDEIRTNLELVEGLIFNFNGKNYKVDSIFSSNNGEPSISIVEDSAFEHITLSKTYSLSEFQRIYDIFATNNTELIDNFKPTEMVKKPAVAPNRVSNFIAAAIKSVNAGNFDEEITTLRGESVEFIGRNQAGESLYNSKSGRRFRMDDNGQAIPENPEILFNGQIVAPRNRLTEFKTLLELSHDIQSSENVVSLKKAAKADPADDIEITEELFNEVLNKAGLSPSLLSEYFQANEDLILYEIQADKSDTSYTFTHKRLEAEIAKKYSLIDNAAKNSGYNISHELLGILRKSHEESINNLRDTVARTYITFDTANRLNDIKLVQLEDALSISVKDAQAAPPEWINSNIKKAMTRADHFTAALLISKAYGSLDEVINATNTADSGDKLAGQELLTALQDKYSKTRILIETPFLISADATLLNDDSSRHVNTQVIENRLYENRKRYADTLYDISNKELNEADIEAFKTSGSVSEFIDTVMEIYNFSYDAANLYHRKVEKELNNRINAEFKQSKETVTLLSVAEILRDKLPAGVTVKATDEPSDSFIRFVFGAGEVTVSRPNHDPYDDTFTVHYRYSVEGSYNSDFERNGSCQYQNLPNPEQIAQDTLSFIAQSFSKTKLYNAPEYGSKFSDGPSKYNLTAIAKSIREDIKEAISNSDLPKGLKVSVRKDSHSIRASITAVPDDLIIWNPEYAYLRSTTDISTPPHGMSRYSHDALSLEAAVKRYVDAYNFDNSDPYTDYYHTNYYSSVSFDNELVSESFDRALEISSGKHSDSLNALTYNIETEALYLGEEFKEMGFIYVDGIRQGLKFTNSGNLVIEGQNDSVALLRKLLADATITAVDSVPDSELLGLAAAFQIYSLQGKSPFSGGHQLTQNSLPLKELVAAEPEHIEISPDDYNKIEIITTANLSFSEAVKQLPNSFGDADVLMERLPCLSGDEPSAKYEVTQSNGLYGVAYLVSVPSGDLNGAMFRVTNAHSLSSAHQLAAEEIQKYLLPVYAAGSRFRMADALVILSEIESSVGHHKIRFDLITDKERAIATQGLEAIKNHYIESKQAEYEGIISQSEYGLSGFTEHGETASFTTRTHLDSTFSWAAKFPISHSSTVKQSFEHSPRYPSHIEAVKSFLRAIEATGLVSTEKIETISEYITGEIVDFRTEKALIVDLSPSDTLLQLDSTNSVKPLKTPNQILPKKIGLESRLIVVGPHAEDVKAYFLDTNKVDVKSREVVTNIARENGAIINGEVIHFANDENLNDFKKATGSTLTISDTGMIESEKWHTTKTIPVITNKLANDLELLGHIKTHIDNTWIAQAHDKSLCQIQYFKGAHNFIEAVVKSQINGFDNTININLIPEESSAQDIINQINDTYKTLGFQQLLGTEKNSSTGVINKSISNLLLSNASLSIENREDGKAIIRGETAKHRNMLSMLGGFEEVGGDWLFAASPIQAISQILSKSKSQIDTLTEDNTHDTESSESRIPTTGQDAASTQRLEPRVDTSTTQRDANGLANQGRRNIEQSGRKNRGNGASTTAISNTRRSSEDSPASDEGTTLDDGIILGRSEPRELFDLANAKASLSTTDHVQLSLSAIQTLLNLRDVNRPATPEEKIALSGMVGLGSSAFNTGGSIFYPSSDKWGNKNARAELSKLLWKLSSAERESIKSTILTGFYTPKFITDFMWSGLEKMGLGSISRPLDIVDPALGTGNFIGGAPDYIRQNANIHGIEADRVTAEIASHLYPEVRVMNQEFQTVLYAPQSKDLIIGNPPYSDVRTYNPNTGKREVLHDLFLRESIKAVRQGGVVTFVTSSGTMDKTNKSLREDIHRTSDLVLAIRLPSSAFKEESGTEVMTDILFFRKRNEGEQPLNTNWLETVEFEHEGESKLFINKYFSENPSHVLGILELGTNQFGPVVKCLDDSIGLKIGLKQMIDKVPSDIFNPSVFKTNINRKKTNDIGANISILGEELPIGSKVGELTLDKNNDVKIIRYSSSEANYFTENAPIPKTQFDLARGYIRLRDTARALIDIESKSSKEQNSLKTEELRTKLNSLYDTFSSQFGSISKKENSRILRADPNFYFASQLEIKDKNTQTISKADIFTKRIINPDTVPVITNSMDAVYRSMSEFGHIVPAFVTDLMGKDWDTIFSEIKDSVFFDPKIGKYLTESIYLSGDVIEKIEFAERALIDRPEMQGNIDALKEVIPKKIPITSIRMKIGATWIPEDALTRFVRSTLDLRSSSTIDKCYVFYNEKLKSWDFKITDMILRDAVKQNTIVHGTPDVPFHKLFRHCLDQTRPTVYEKNSDGTSYVNEVKTQIARDKQNQIEERFVEFILADHDLAESLETAYNYRMNRWVLNNPDGKYLSFPGITNTIKGKPFKHGLHQLSVIERALTSEYGILIAHEAGGGKTISTVTIAMKAKQIGLANKPLIAVPNHMLVQYTLEALDLYPNARILTISKEDLSREGREQFAFKAQLNDWDLVICTHEQFTKMKMPESIVNKSINDEIIDLSELLEESKNDRKTAKQLERQIKSLKEKLKSEIASLEKNQDEIDFTTLGIDWVGYDEAHYLKNRAFPSKNSNLAGVQTLTSQRARDAELKFDWIRESRGDSKGVLLATGTPISNTIGEIMVMLRYTAPELIRNAGIYNFDDFIANFGETKVHVELTADGSSYQLKERLSGFHNIPELMRLFSQVADIKMGDQLDLKRPNSSKVTRVSEMSPEQYMFMDWLSNRAQKVKKRMVDPSKDNMLNIYTDLQTISVDPRLYHPKLQDAQNSKTNLETKDIFETWKQGHVNKDTQLIFIDRYQKTSKFVDGFNEKTKKPKIKTVVEFNLIEDMTEKLVNMGIPREQIGSIHDTKSDDDKEDFFSKIRNGDIRVVFASTAKMGVGTNVQTRGKHLRHMTYPMRSIDIEQRNKRFVRQGNMNNEVFLHYPTTKDSGDLSLLQMIERKDQMTKQIMSCDFENMARSYEEDFSPSYEDIMAITTGNNAIKQKLQLDSELDKLYRMRKSHNFQSYELNKEARYIINKRIPESEKFIDDSKKLRQAIQSQMLDSFSMTINGTTYNKVSLAGVELHREASKLTLYGQRKTVGQYLGADLVMSLSKSGIHTISIEVNNVKLSTNVTEHIQSFPNQIANTIKARIRNIEDGEIILQEMHTEADKLKLRANEPFKHEARIVEVEEELREVNIELSNLESSRQEPENGSIHPFEKLIFQLDGKSLEEEDTIKTNILTETQIQQILEAEAQVESNKPTITLDR